ncbi:hypothetical protein BDA99DRAFT_572383 [Phascolomyces articulosus]|uniref:Uncharacterized protein n=1 Tax=Phascolomyces articulosus TaxID=60185 RepID=A0AAD5PDL6_9FUNG|nr:hypothetical protein BDA99DRAFT_572383 [Phascolomyces articulosus]
MHYLTDECIKAEFLHFIVMQLFDRPPPSCIFFLTFCKFYDGMVVKNLGYWFRRECYFGCEYFGQRHYTKISNGLGGVASTLTALDIHFVGHSVRSNALVTFSQALNICPYLRSIKDFAQTTQNKSEEYAWLNNSQPSGPKAPVASSIFRSTEDITPLIGNYHAALRALYIESTLPLNGVFILSTPQAESAFLPNIQVEFEPCV